MVAAIGDNIDLNKGLYVLTSQFFFNSNLTNCLTHESFSCSVTLPSYPNLEIHFQGLVPGNRYPSNYFLFPFVSQPPSLKFHAEVHCPDPSTLPTACITYPPLPIGGTVPDPTHCTCFLIPSVFLSLLLYSTAEFPQ